MQDNDAPINEEEETPESEEESPTEEEETPKTPRRVEPEPDTKEEEVEESEAKGSEDTEKALRAEIVKLKEEIAEISDQIARKQEPEEDLEPTPDDELYKDLLVDENWKPGKETYSALFKEIFKRQPELIRRVIADEVRKAQGAQTAEEKELAQIAQTFYRGIDRLRAEGKIPLVKDPDDPNDPGIKAEKAIENLAIRYNTVDVDLLYKDIYSKNIQRKKPTHPISKPTKGKPDVSKVINYEKEIKGKSLMDIISEDEGE